MTHPNKTMTLLAMTCLTACLAAGCASGPEKPGSSPSSSASGEKASSKRTLALKDDALRDALEDKTHVGKFGPAPFKAYFAKDGTVEADVGGDPFAGRWEVESADTFCIEWSTPPIPRGCSFIVLEDGQTGETYKVEDGTVRNTMTILPGKQL